MGTSGHIVHGKTFHIRAEGTFSHLPHSVYIQNRYGFLEKERGNRLIIQESIPIKVVRNKLVKNFIKFTRLTESDYAQL